MASHKVNNRPAIKRALRPGWAAHQSLSVTQTKKGGKPGQASKAPLRAPAERPWQSNGIQVSIGPGPNAKNVVNWLTFPVTPETIPVEHSASIERYRTVGSGEFPSFDEANLDTVSFSGRLEPPSYYVQGTALPPGFHELAGAGQTDPNLAAQFLQGALVSGGSVTPSPDSLVMEDGAYAGPRWYLEPHAFKELLRKTCRQGEPLRLVIGDNYGYNGLALIETFGWRFEDPDPDVLLFDIAFLEWREHVPLGATRAALKPKQKHYVTKLGDTLASIAKAMWGEEFQWRTIAQLNKDLIGKLWWYPDELGAGTKAWRQKGSLGKRIGGRSDGFQLTLNKIKAKDDMISPDLPFRAGITLLLDKGDGQEKSDSKGKAKGKDKGKGKKPIPTGGVSAKSLGKKKK